MLLKGRVSMINERVGEIEQGKFLELITGVDERERLRETVCIGVNWKYTTEELSQLAEVNTTIKQKRKPLVTIFISIFYLSITFKKCIGAIALSSLCRLLAEEFGQRRGGMPDLW